MWRLWRTRRRRAAALAVVFSGAILAAAADGGSEDRVPILAYHRFGPVVADSMTVTTATFEEHLRYLAEHDYVVIPLRRLVEYRRGEGPGLPSRAVVITADDGHRSVYTDMYPLIRRFDVPVTLFVYPSAISRADYALTWDQLRELRRSGLFDVQSHTYWHPNFRTEKARLSPDQYDAFVTRQLERSRATLERELGGVVDILAWPFGIYDRDLVTRAARAGYVAAVSLDERPATRDDDPMTLPRYLMTEHVKGAAFARLLAASARARGAR